MSFRRPGTCSTWNSLNYSTGRSETSCNPYRELKIPKVSIKKSKILNRPPEVANALTM
jgi:hypothetical protein